MKNIDYAILSELMKNSKTSDKKLAQKLGISQPTVTRRRSKLETSLIDGYTAIPKWKDLGFKIMAITLVRSKPSNATKDNFQLVREREIAWLKDQSNIIMSGGCRGAGADAFMISIHKTYGEYDKFMRDQRLKMGDLQENVQSVVVNLAGEEILKPLHFKYLTETM